MLLWSSARIVLVLLLCGFYLSCTMWMLYCLCCNLLLSRAWLVPFGWCIGDFLDVYSMGASCGWFSWFNFVPDSSMADFRMAGPSGTWFHRFVTVEEVSVIMHLCYLLLV
jgi:hypothetical protein